MKAALNHFVWLGVVVCLCYTTKQIYEFRVVQHAAEYANRQVLMEEAIDRGCSIAADVIICPMTAKPLPPRHAVAEKHNFESR